MKKIILYSFFIISTLLILNCNSSTNNNSTVSDKSAYEKMELAFVDRPDKSEIQPLLEKIMQIQGTTITEINLERSGSVLVTLRKSSKNGVTEMDILKHMSETAIEEIGFPDQAAISFTLLESEY